MAGKNPAVRGMVTATRSRASERTKPPRIIDRAPEEAPAAPSESFSYKTNRARFHSIKLTTLAGKDAEDLRKRTRDEPNWAPSEDEALTLAALAHEPDGRLQFRDWSYHTRSRAVAAWINARLRQGRLPGVGRDAETLRIRCAHCEETFVNSPQGREELETHLLEEHEAAELAAFLQPPVLLEETAS